MIGSRGRGANVSDRKYDGIKGRIYVEKVKGVPTRRRKSQTITAPASSNDGLIDMHVSGAYFRFTDKGAQRFA
jgi:hypothetical protein